jgi:hypothetical protein
MRKYLYVVILITYLPLLLFAQIDVDTIYIWDNDRGKSAQRNPATGFFANGRGMAIWDDTRWGDYDIFGQEYNVGKNLVGSNFPVSIDDYNRYQQFNCDITCNSKNVFIAAWEESLYTPSQKPSLLYACLYEHEPFRVYDHEGSQKCPSLSSRSDGWFAISWTSYQTEPEPVILCKIYDENGEERVFNTVWEGVRITSYVPVSGVAYCDTGLLVVYEDWENATEISIYGQYCDRNGEILKDRFKISYYAGGSEKNEKDPAVATNEYGDMVVVWEDDYSGSEIWAQKMKGHVDGYSFDGGPFAVCPDVGPQRNPRVTMFPNGDFVVVWEENRSGEIDVWARAWIGQEPRTPFRIPVNNSDRQAQPYPSAVWSDLLGIVWSSWVNHYKYPDVYLRLFKWDNGQSTGLYPQSGDIPLVAVDPDTNVGGRKCWYFDDENYDNPATPWNEDPIDEPDSSYVDLDIAIVDQLMELNTNNQYFVIVADTIPTRRSGDDLSDYDALFLDLGYRTAFSSAGELTALECAEIVDFMETYKKPVWLDGNDFGYMYDTTYLFSLFRADFQGDGAVYTTGNIDTLYGLDYAKDQEFGYAYQGMVDNYPDSIRPTGGQGGRVILETKDLDDWYASYSVGFCMAWKEGDRASGNTVYNSFIPTAITTTTHPHTYAEYYRRCLGHLQLACQPEPIVDLTTDTVGLGEGEVKLSWTIVADDDLSDPVNDGYQLKFSRTKMTSESAYNAAEEYYQEWFTGGTVDDPVSETCYGLPPLDTLIFALKCHDDDDLYNALGAEPQMVVPGDSVTPHNIVIGDNYVRDFSRRYEFLHRYPHTTGNDSLFVSWDADSFYIGLAGQSFVGSGDLLIYFDISDGSGADSTFPHNGTSTNRARFNAAVGEFRPDYCFILETYNSIRLYQCTAKDGRDTWSLVTFHGQYSEDNVVNNYRYTEISIPFSDFSGYSTSNQFEMVATIQNEFNNQRSHIYPPFNPIGTGTITQYYRWTRLVSGMVPKYTASIIGIEEQQAIPDLYTNGKALCAVPNPFNATVDLYMNTSTITPGQHVALRIFDVTGRMVREFDLSTIIPSHLPKVTCDGTDDRGMKVARGIYFCELITEGKTAMEKIIYVR